MTMIKIVDTPTHSISLNENSEYFKDGYADSLKADKELAWRDSELKRTDNLALLPDYPYMTELIAYRVELRDYPSKTGFPNCDRPVFTQ